MEITKYKPVNIKKYLNFDGQLKGRDTAKVYGYLLKKFDAYLCDNSLKKWRENPGLVTRQIIIAYLETLEATGQSNSSLNSNMKAIKRFYKLLQEKQVVKVNPCDGMKYYSEKPCSAKGKWLNDKQLVQLYEVMKARRNTIIGMRDFAIIHLLFKTGLRASELCDMKFSDITYQDEKLVELIVRRGKGGKYRTVECDDNVLKPLFEYREAAGLPVPDDKKDYFFYSTVTNLNKISKPVDRHTLFSIVRRAGKKIKVNLHPHSFRHTFCTHALMRGANMNAVSKAAGHSSISITASIYDNSPVECLKYLDYDFCKV